MAVAADRAVRAQPAKGVREDRRRGDDSASRMTPVALAALEQRCSAGEANREPTLESSTVRGVD